MLPARVAGAGGTRAVANGHKVASHCKCVTLWFWKPEGWCGSHGSRCQPGCGPFRKLWKRVCPPGSGRCNVLGCGPSGQLERAARSLTVHVSDPLPPLPHVLGGEQTRSWILGWGGFRAPPTRLCLPWAFSDCGFRALGPRGLTSSVEV